MFIALISSCEETENVPVQGIKNAELLSFSDCKTGKSSLLINSVSANQSCIEYFYSDSILTITHINAGFNCCPGNISADFDFTGNSITITEFEATADCNCNCLYDIEMQIGNLQSGIYNVYLVEPYAIQTGTQIEFTINLNDSLAGSYCVQRDFYPWGIY